MLLMPGSTEALWLDSHTLLHALLLMVWAQISDSNYVTCTVAILFVHVKLAPSACPLGVMH